MKIRSSLPNTVVVRLAESVGRCMDVLPCLFVRTIVWRTNSWYWHFFDRWPYRWLLNAVTVVCCLLCAAGIAAQATPQNLPDSPVPQNPSPNTAASQTKRILDVVPNFRAVNAGQNLPPQTVKQKFVGATEDSFDYSSVFIPAALAGYSIATHATPEFHQGAAGYARYFWHAAVDQTSENYMVEFAVPVITHEDARYYTLGSGGFLRRMGYALSRAVITRSDTGNDVFNASEVIGAGVASGLSSLYYPSRERSFANTGTEWGLDIGIDAASFVAKEFWPDINRRLFHGGKSTDRQSQ